MRTSSSQHSFPRGGHWQASQKCDCPSLDLSPRSNPRLSSLRRQCQRPLRLPGSPQRRRPKAWPPRQRLRLCSKHQLEPLRRPLQHPRLFQVFRLPPGLMWGSRMSLLRSFSLLSWQVIPRLARPSFNSARGWGPWLRLQQRLRTQSEGGRRVSPQTRVP